MKARVIKVDHATTSKGNPCSYVWVIPEGCELPGKLYCNGHVDFAKGSFINITIEPDYRCSLVVKVVQ